MSPPGPAWRWESPEAEALHGVSEEELLRVPSWRRDTLKKDGLRRASRADLADEPKRTTREYARGMYFSLRLGPLPALSEGTRLLLAEPLCLCDLPPGDEGGNHEHNELRCDQDDLGDIGPIRTRIHGVHSCHRATWRA